MFEQTQRCQAPHRANDIYGSVKRLDAALSSALGVASSLKPEVSIMLEVCEAEKVGKALTVSMLGLVGDIPQTTMLRYLALLESDGRIERVAHPTDHRMTYVRPTPAARLAVELALDSV